MNELTPYRGARAREVAPPPSELLCPWRDEEQRAAPMRATVGSWFGLVLAVLVGFFSPVAAAVIFAGVVAWAVTTWQRGRAAAGVRLTVERGVLSIERSAEEHPIRVPLDTIIDVEIEHKKFKRLAIEQQVGAPMMTTRVGPETSIGRIAFVLDTDDAPVYLSESFTSNFHCTEWLGKVRLFLRAYGWVPDDEMEPADPHPPPRAA